MKLAAFDFYPKTLQEFRQRTLTGAAVSVSCTVLIAVLTVIEVADYSEVKQDGHLFVDTSRGQQLRINRLRRPGQLGLMTPAFLVASNMARRSKTKVEVEVIAAQLKRKSTGSLANDGGFASTGGNSHRRQSWSPARQTFVLQKR